MHQFWPWQPAVNQSSHSLRLQPDLLAAPFQRMPPVPSEAFPKQLQARPVPRYRVVLVVAVEYTLEPLAKRRHRFVHPRPKLLLNCLQFRFYTFAYRPPPNGKIPRTVGSAAMREPQKRETLRFPFPSLFPIDLCKPAKLDQPRLVRMQFQPELRQPFPKRVQEPFGFVPVLKPHHKVSSPRESHPEALSEPYLNLSAHTAPAMEPRRSPICQ